VHAADVLQVQAPMVQRSEVSAQTVPHAPQLFLSTCVLMHEPLQHTWPPPHERPHAPQFSGSSSPVMH
jgi:hypothetical protein